MGIGSTSLNDCLCLFLIPVRRPTPVSLACPPYRHCVLCYTLKHKVKCYGAGAWQWLLSVSSTSRRASPPRCSRRWSARATLSSRPAGSRTPTSSSSTSSPWWRWEPREPTRSTSVKPGILKSWSKKITHDNTRLQPYFIQWREDRRVFFVLLVIVFCPIQVVLILKRRPKSVVVTPRWKVLGSIPDIHSSPAGMSIAC